MRLERDDFCFACGKDNPRGLKLKIEVDRDGARFEYRVPENLQGWQGVTHGGIISTMLDEDMVWAAAGREIEVVTAEMTVRFTNPLPTGHKIKVQGRIVKESSKLLQAEASAFDSEKVYALATGKLVRLDG